MAVGVFTCHPCEPYRRFKGDTSIPKGAEQGEDQIVAFLKALTDRYKPAKSSQYARTRWILCNGEKGNDEV